MSYSTDDEARDRRLLLASNLALLAAALTAIGVCGGALIGVPPELTLLPAVLLLIPAAVLFVWDRRLRRKRRKRR